VPFDPPSRNGTGPFDIQHELQDVMQDRVGIVRSDDDMRNGLAAVETLRERARGVGVPGNREYNPGWHTALDLHNLLTVSEAIARAAIERTESRGAHFREDHPSKEPQWDRTRIIIARGDDGAMQVRREKVPEMPAELAQIIEEFK
jgi:succinate dehydrogenase / fumarate reductase, flavoprotein subunit